MRLPHKATVPTARAPRESVSYPAEHSEATRSIPFPWNQPEWNDSDRWERGPWLPVGAKLVPPGSIGRSRL
jgi:hypothetical protein